MIIAAPAAGHDDVRHAAPLAARIRAVAGEAGASATRRGTPRLAASVTVSE
jgi:hypothetical protein